jgi:hypothetical protein
VVSFGKGLTILDKKIWDSWGEVKMLTLTGVRKKLSPTTFMYDFEGSKT